MFWSLKSLRNTSVISSNNEVNISISPYLHASFFRINLYLNIKMHLKKSCLQPRKSGALGIYVLLDWSKLSVKMDIFIPSGQVTQMILIYWFKTQTPKEYHVSFRGASYLLGLMDSPIYFKGVPICFVRWKIGK